MAQELPELIKCHLTSKGFFVEDPEATKALEERGYGERAGDRLSLHDYEVLYLLYIGRLRVEQDTQLLSMDSIVKRALKRDPAAWTRFLIYRDLRSRGYAVREGFGFEVDFRVYDKGDYGSKPAKFVVFGLSEGSEISVKSLDKAIREISVMGKEPVIAVIERRGEVIYYRVNKADLSRV